MTATSLVARIHRARSHSVLRSARPMSTNKRIVLARVVAGVALVEGCSLYQGAYGAPVDAAEEARKFEVRRREVDGTLGGILGVPSGHGVTTMSTRRAGGGGEEGPSGEGEDAGWGLNVRRRWRAANASVKPVNDRCVNCTAAPFVLKTVENLYLRGFADGVAALAPHVTFEDPAVGAVYLPCMRPLPSSDRAHPITHRDATTITRTHARARISSYTSMPQAMSTTCTRVERGAQEVDDVIFLV